jgi:tRNA threonylcarbamoyladenosine biosynthesis protein TsaB
VSAILCIDTASESFALALDINGSVTSYEAPAEQDHSRRLLPAIKELAGERQLEAILVIIGPGAYAGLRVGIATAQGLSLARGIPVYGIGTLEAVALACGNPGSFTVIQPAGRGTFAAQDFRGSSAHGPARVAAPTDLSGAIVGEGAGALGGTEIGARLRCEAALRDRGPKIREGSLDPGAEAFYLREPSITISRRAARAAS